MSLADYRSHRGVPPLAGLCTFEEAGRPGLSVEECVRRLKRYHYAFKRLHEIFVARLTAEPLYELKTAFAHHAYLCAEHVAALRERVSEMREPPLGLEAVADPNLEILFDEILAAPTTETLLLGIYHVAMPDLKFDLSDHLRETNPLADAPTVRICRFAALELADMIRFGSDAIRALAARQRDLAVAQWLSMLHECTVDAADGGDDPDDADAKRWGDITYGADHREPIRRIYSATPYAYDPVPRRDERFPDPYNMGVNAEAFLYDESMPADAKVLMLLYDESMPPDAKVLMLLYKRLREVDVPEMMASILHQTKGKPWEYYRAMTRQLWDEARHAMMGEVGFAALGIDWPKFVAVNFNWSLALNTQLGPKERHAVLYFIEQGLMPKTGKRYEWEVATAAADPLARTFQDYDWADEVLHSRIGRDWYVRDQFGGDGKAANAYGDACWNRVFVDWQRLRDDGLTQHRNWWPDLYREACRLRGTAPDPRVAAFDLTYEKTRADLKNVSASG